ncbi:MAG: DUF4266 domain-containing protein [Methylococcales bacterium]|nr:DUF4266 domain-containing protein [Methylococcales bacterium]
MKPSKLALLIAVSISLSSCAQIQPWERGILAKPQMAMTPYPMESALRSHNYGSRESASGGSSASGGGCGCY